MEFASDVLFSYYQNVAKRGYDIELRPAQGSAWIMVAGGLKMCLENNYPIPKYLAQLKDALEMNGGDSARFKKEIFNDRSATELRLESANAVPSVFVAASESIPSDKLEALLLSTISSYGGMRFIF